MEQQLLFWPDHLNADTLWDEYAKGIINEVSDESSDDEDQPCDQSESDFGLGNYKIPNINWSFTPVYKHFYAFRQNPHKINTEKDIYSEQEVEYILSMIKQRENEFRVTDVCKPFFKKALLTLEHLLQEQTLELLYERLVQLYSHINLQNTMKLLIRCKLAFNSRAMLMKLFQYVTKFKEAIDEFKIVMEKLKIPTLASQDLVKEMRQAAGHAIKIGSMLVMHWGKMQQSSHRQFRNKPLRMAYAQFLNNRKINLLNVIKKEMSEVRRITDAVVEHSR